MVGVDGRVVVVTGAGGGLGREHALLLASRGAHVVVNDLGSTREGSGAAAQPADETVKLIQDRGGQAIADHADISTSAGGSSVIDAALSHFGRIDAVVCNAGILRDSTFHKMSDQAWDAVLRVHLYGTYNVVRPAWPKMRDQGHGRVVVTTSISGTQGNFGQANYGAAKLGVVGLINTLALEGARYGITANAISPVADTRMTEDIITADKRERLAAEYVSPAVVHLVSDDCTDTGTIVVAGGGLYTRMEYAHGPGHRFDEVPTPEELAARWQDVMTLETITWGRPAI